MVFADLVLFADLEPAQEYGLIAYLVVLLLALVLAIRMTRRRDFSLTTQDLLILLVVVLVPQLPFEIMDEYAVSGIALVLAVLMYTSEYVINRATRMVAFSFAGALTGLALYWLP